MRYTGVAALLHPLRLADEQQRLSVIFRLHQVTSLVGPDHHHQSTVGPPWPRFTESSGWLGGLTRRYGWLQGTRFAGRCALGGLLILPMLALLAVGVAGLQPSESLADCIVLADQALYAAKGQCRDKVRSAA